MAETSEISKLIQRVEACEGPDREIDEALHAALNIPVPVGRPIEITEELIRYIVRYGGSCRDCADEAGVCPSSGLPCEGADKAVRHVLTALNYGSKHGYLPSPSPPGEPAPNPYGPLIEAAKEYREARIHRKHSDYEKLCGTLLLNAAERLEGEGHD